MPRRNNTWIQFDVIAILAYGSGGPWGCGLPAWAGIVIFFDVIAMPAVCVMLWFAGMGSVFGLLPWYLWLAAMVT